MAIIGVEGDLTNEMVESEGANSRGVMLRGWNNVPQFLHNDTEGWKFVREFFVCHSTRSSI